MPYRAIRGLRPMVRPRFSDFIQNHVGPGDALSRFVCLSPDGVVVESGRMPTLYMYYILYYIMLYIYVYIWIYLSNNETYIVYLSSSI